MLGACRFGFATVDEIDGRTPDDGAIGVGANPSKLVLFVRGGAGTVGLNNTGGDANACDTTDNASGEGWGKLATRLVMKGFTVVEHLEGPKAARGPADLSNLAQYGIVVFGSNNWTYGAADADAVEAYVRAGGGVLLISDAGFGLTTFSEAPSSDQTFAGRFDLAMDQDNGMGTPTTITSPQYALPTHPILTGVTSFEGIGTSAITVTNNIADVSPVILVAATGTVRNNDAAMGTSRAATAADGILVAAQVGAGRVAAYWDRDTFTNGTIAAEADAKLADNLFAWLHGAL